MRRTVPVGFCQWDHHQALSVRVAWRSVLPLEYHAIAATGPLLLPVVQHLMSFPLHCAVLGRHVHRRAPGGHRRRAGSVQPVSG